MNQNYSNLPVDSVKEKTVQAFDAYYSLPLEINASVLAAMKGYFTNRGFGEVAAESIAITIIRQSKSDGYNPMQILDTLKGLDDVQLSGLVSEILNYNRFKTSNLGYAEAFNTQPEILRNIQGEELLAARDYKPIPRVKKVNKVSVNLKKRV